MSRPKSLLTRVLHVASLLAVVQQLISSLLMERPLPGDDAEAPYVAHIGGGTAALSILIAFWLWTLVRDPAETPFSHLVPWIFPRRLLALAKETQGLIADLVNRRRPSLHQPAIAGAVHGLGLALATALAASGALWYFLLQEAAAGRFVLMAHQAAGNLMWVYLIGHATMALLHHFLGEATLVAMFGLKLRGEPEAEPARTK